MTPTRQTVFVVDDNRSVRKSLERLFGTAGLHAETYGSNREFLAAYDPRRAGYLVLDLRLRGEHGLDLLDELGARGTSLPVIVLTAHGSVPASVRALKAGAIDFLEKPTPPATLLARVREALALGEKRHEADAEQRLIEQRAARFTPRERQVAQLLMLGRKSKQIADSLGVSARTIEGYRSKLLAKMQVTSATELIATLLRARVVPPA